MSQKKMTSLQRVITTLGHQEPDRVPFFLLANMHGSKELGLSIKEYFSSAENVAEGELRLRHKYRHDCVSNFFFAAIEVEAWGAEVIYYDDGPANSAAPFIRKPEDILSLVHPKVKDCACLLKVLKTTEILRESVADEAPVIGVVISPFTLPIMQMGFNNYIDLMYERPELFERLMKVNEEFCVEWANAQLESGAAAICYFDPVSSPTVIPKEMFLKLGFELTKRTLSRIQGPTAIHLASGRCLPIIDDLIKAGTEIIGTSAIEDLAEVKKALKDKVTVLGNLNGIEMRHWTPEQAEFIVKDAIAKAGTGGGYILCDNHGEIPYQVPDEVLTAISESVHKWGQYPLDWIENK